MVEVPGAMAFASVLVAITLVGYVVLGVLALFPVESVIALMAKLVSWARRAGAGVT